MGIGACLFFTFGCRTTTFVSTALEEMISDDSTTTSPKPTGLLQQELIYIRPRKFATKAFTLATIGPVSSTSKTALSRPKQASLHVLARHKKPKAAALKRAGAAEPPPEITAEVIDVLKVAWYRRPLCEIQAQTKDIRGENATRSPSWIGNRSGIPVRR